MIAVLKHELKGYFHSLTAYVCGAFLLAFLGVGAMLYNINAAVTNFEFVLGFGSILFAVVVPILTMRVLAEERKQKTDQLLYSLPITTTQVILGKYAALLIVFAVPMGLVCLYPLIFSQFGDVYLPTAYGSLLAFFLVGSALISLGVFISSLTENQGLAAGIGIAAILLNYFSVQLAEYVSATSIGSFIAILVLIMGLGLLIRHLTKSEGLATGISFLLMAGSLAAYLIAPESFEGLLPKIMTELSLFAHLDVFVNGVFDVNGIVFFLSVIVLFLTLTVQSMEKRRYN